MCDDDTIGVLEVNPRPPASMALYAQPGLIDAQLRACLNDELPQPGALARAPVSGSEIVYARMRAAARRARPRGACSIGRMRTTCLLPAHASHPVTRSAA